MIKTVKCPILNASEGGLIRPLEIFLKFNTDEKPIGIMGRYKYDSQKNLCKIKKKPCLYSEGWKFLPKP